MEKLFEKILKAHQECKSCASPRETDLWFNDLLGFLFPDLLDEKLKNIDEVQTKWEELKIGLERILKSINPTKSSEWTKDFFEEIPKIYQALLADVEAHFLGDPAAKSKREVVVSYPGFWAVSSYRIANALYKQKIEIIPRLITENAHSKTGIDIHPGAKIGKNFCIDHGTGIVIGETTIIGENVKIYQGVTLGALSVDKKDADKKRHPTIEDDVVIYSGATILGGKTTIGKGSVIGGNVWITKSIEPNSKIYYINSFSKNED